MRPFNFRGVYRPRSDCGTYVTMHHMVAQGSIGEDETNQRLSLSRPYSEHHHSGTQSFYMWWHRLCPRHMVYCDKEGHCLNYK